MNDRIAWKLVLIALLLMVVALQLVAIWRLPGGIQSDVHTLTLNWPAQEIPAKTVLSGYVGNWSWPMNVRIVAVQVWMGNPYGTLWEGDIYVTLNNRGIFNNSTDQVIVHYQLDKHAESSMPHQLMFQIGSEGSGFLMKAGQTVWIWRSFNNISDHSATAGDGQVIVYYEDG